MSFEGKKMDGTVDHHVKGNKPDPEVRISPVFRVHDKNLYLGKCHNEAYYLIQFMYANKKINRKLTQWIPQP